MAPKQQRVVVQKAEPRRPAPKGYVQNVYGTLTSPENASVVRSVAIFGVSLLSSVDFGAGLEIREEKIEENGDERSGSWSSRGVES